MRASYTAPPYSPWNLLGRRPPPTLQVAVDGNRAPTAAAMAFKHSEFIDKIMQVVGLENKGSV